MSVYAYINSAISRIDFNTDYGRSFLTAYGLAGNSNAPILIGSVPLQAVPGPEAGAGLAALALGGLTLYIKRRGKKEVSAA